MSELVDTLKSLQEQLGPQRVKTPQLEVEQFSLKELLSAADRTVAKPVQLHKFPMTIARPKYGMVCCPSKTGCSCSE
jgi:hypothetical protein